MHFPGADKEDYLLALTRYNPEDYKWSSYRDYLRKSGDSFVDIEMVLRQFSGDAIRARRLV